jgi:hypothetical protein
MKGLKKIEPEFLAQHIKENYRYLNRYDRLSDRYYFIEKDGMFIPGMSFTTLAKKVIPKDGPYMQWLMRNGREAMVMAREAAVFGTIFHVEATKPLKGDDPIHGNGYDLDWLDKEIPGQWTLTETGERIKLTNFHMLIPRGYRHLAEEWIRPFKKGLLAWMQFLHEKVEDVIAIEVPIFDEEYLVGGTLDLVHTSTFYGKLRGWYTDIKSFLFNELEHRKKTYFPEHEFQLELSKFVWNREYGDLFEITHLANWSPKNWKGSKPTYTWKNQTNNRYAEEVQLLGQKMLRIQVELERAKAMDLVKFPSSAMTMGGKVENWRNFNSENHINIETWDESTKIIQA